MAELVVTCLFVRVAEDGIGLGGLLEFLLGLFVAGIAVGMVFQSEFAVGLFQVFRSGVFVNAQDFVVISFCHNSLLPF